MTQPFRMPIVCARINEKHGPPSGREELLRYEKRTRTCCKKKDLCDKPTASQCPDRPVGRIVS